ncbi:hypothetical protein N0V84_011699 [Fusarium piperis]|uniref:Uncharacterized protein n=1 Tax=Fusarium piperis TaxID=1435070 RepID=A0A9W8TCW4_9HYPO|nr:hypothetical protein N0V84_011699 [Fusarium piperis]
MPLLMRKVSCRSSTSRNNDARDDAQRDQRHDDTNRVVDRAILEVCPHPPPSDYRVVRFTVGLVNTSDSGRNTLAGQPIELCFHHDFEASPRRPLSLHLDRSYLTYYGIPPVLEAPLPPGVIIELGRVEVLPDDPRSLALLEDQIQREVDEDAERRSRQSVDADLLQSLALGGGNGIHTLHSAIRRVYEAITRNRVDQPWAWFGLLSLVICLLSIALGLQRPTPPSSPVAIVPLMEHLTNITFTTTTLCPMVFFNQHRYPTIGNSSNSDMPTDKTSTLELSWRLTRWLVKRMEKPMSWEAWRLYQSTSQDEDAALRFLDHSLWEFAGVQFEEAKMVKGKVNLLSRRAESLWESMEESIFNWWVRIQVASLGRVAGNVMRFVELNPEDDMFITQGNASLSWIPETSLPKQMPRGVCDILDSYRTLFLQHDHLSNSCQVFRDCAEPIPTFAPLTQAVHPSCFSLASTDTNSMVERLAVWAASARGRNLTWDLPHSMPSRSKIFTANHLKDTIEQALEMAETVDKEWVKVQVTHAKEMVQWANQMMPKSKAPSSQNNSVWSKWKGWLGIREVNDVQVKESMKQLTEIVQVHISRQLRDTVEGLGELRIICQQMDTLSSLVDDLYSPESWILNKNETSGHVQLWKLPSPKEQALAIRSLQTELLNRHQIMEKHQKLYQELERAGRLRRENKEDKEGTKV